MIYELSKWDCNCNIWWWNLIVVVGCQRGKNPKNDSKKSNYERMIPFQATNEVNPMRLNPKPKMEWSRMSPFSPQYFNFSIIPHIIFCFLSVALWSSNSYLYLLLHHPLGFIWTNLCLLTKATLSTKDNESIEYLCWPIWQTKIMNP